MTTVNMHDAKTHFFRLVARARAGERIVIAKAGQPVAVLSAFVDRPRRRKPGFDKGRLWMSDDFDAPLPDELQAALVEVVPVLTADPRFKAYGVDVVW